MNLIQMLHHTLSRLDPDPGDWPTGDQVEAIVQTVRMWEDDVRPVVRVMRADPHTEPSDRWIVQVDTVPETGNVTIYLNDGDPLFDGDPEG